MARIRDDGLEYDDPLDRVTGHIWEEPEISLLHLGTTRNNIRPGDRPQFQAKVSNTGDAASSVTAEWTVDGETVAERTAQIDEGETHTMAARVSYDDIRDAGGIGNARLTVAIDGEGTQPNAERSRTINVEQETTDSGGSGGDTTPGGCIPGYDCAGDPNDPHGGSTDDESDESDEGSTDDDGSGPSGSVLPAGFPTLPALGGLSAEQTTALALAVVVLVVLTR